MKLKDKQIKIVEVVITENKNGFTTEKWKPIHKGYLWAYYRHLSGREVWASNTVNEKEDVIFIINWRNDINTQMLIEYNGKYYNITRIDDFEGYKKDLSVYCKLSERQSPDDPAGGVQ